jgi:hypothetical protein
VLSALAGFLAIGGAAGEKVIAGGNVRCTICARLNLATPEDFPEI